MIVHIQQEDVIRHWPAIETLIGKYWHATINFETVPNLKRRILAEDCSLFMHVHEDGSRFLFVTEHRDTATAKILTVTHTAGHNRSGRRFKKAQVKERIKGIFSEIEDMARTLGYDAVAIHARPGHVAMADDYEVWTTTIIKNVK